MKSRKYLKEIRKKSPIIITDKENQVIEESEKMSFSQKEHVEKTGGNSISDLISESDIAKLKQIK